MPKIRKKQYIDQNVLDKARDRIRYLYERFDDVVVSFSGGKDSTALLLCTLDVAKELDRLPVKAVFYDEEAIHPPTIEYVRRIYDRDDVDLEWVCLPIKHRNACSNQQPYWHCWHPEEKDIWVRDMPDDIPVTTEHDRFEFGMSMQGFGLAQFKNTNICVLQGIRTEESLRRYRVVAMKKNDNYISTPEKGVFFAFPIYDMSSKDVWKVVSDKQEDYNRTYDVFNKTEMYENFLRQRVCPPYGEEPVRGLHIYAECFPEMWERMINRVKGAATAARYGNTELYSSGYKPDQVSWRDHVQNVLDSFDDATKPKVAKVLNSAIKQHKNKTSDKIPEVDPHPLSGCSWSFLSKIVTRGDLKGRIIQNMQQQAEKTRNSMGITMQEAEKLYGKK